MKWVVVSDNHGLEQILTDIKSIHDDADLLIHLGDSEFNYHHHELKGYIKVAGNCDYGVEFKDDAVISANGMNAYITHGHLHRVNRGLEALAAAARDEQCKLAFYGHTHIRQVDYVDGVVCINPGSIAQSRSQEPESYAVITIDDTEQRITFFNQQHEMMAEEVVAL